MMVSQEILILEKFDELLLMLRTSKPEERSEMARRYAVTITELEKVAAYFAVYAAGQCRPPKE